MIHPHEILNKQAYIKNTNVRVKVTDFSFKKNKGSTVDVTFLDTPTKQCYALANHIYGTVNNYKDDGTEEITGTFSFKYISNIPYDTKQAKLLFNGEEND